jgi:hypothetical protein
MEPSQFADHNGELAGCKQRPLDAADWRWLSWLRRVYDRVYPGEPRARALWISELREPVQGGPKQGAPRRGVWERGGQG